MNIPRSGLSTFLPEMSYMLPLLPLSVNVWSMPEVRAFVCYVDHVSLAFGLYVIEPSLGQPVVHARVVNVNHIRLLISSLQA